MYRYVPGLALLLGLIFPVSGQGVVTPPGQPADGPGGAAYPHGAVDVARFGEGVHAYWLYEPAAPAPAAAPVVVFNHGWSAMNPDIYGAWIHHLVRRGNVVIFPLFQENLRTPNRDFTPNAIAAVRDALARLREPGHVHPDLTRVAVFGHSAGGLIAASMAALAATTGLPQPRAVLCVQPGATWMRPARLAATLADMRAVPAGTLLLAVTGDRDTVSGEIDARRIIRETTGIPAADKNLVRLHSDDHGTPGLHATHFAPVASGPVDTDALDYYGCWKLGDALLDAAFQGTNRRYALGNTPEQCYMGVWSDGVPVKELEVVDVP